MVERIDSFQNGAGYRGGGGPSRGGGYDRDGPRGSGGNPFLGGKGGGKGRGGRRDDFYGGSSGSHGGPRDTYHDRGNYSNAMGGGGGTFVVPNVEADGPPDENDEETVKLRGLPFRATKRDVVNFFEPEFMIEAQQVFICMEERTGRPSGQALVKMLSTTEQIHLRF